MEVDFFTPNVAFFVCVTLSRYMKMGENLLNEVPVEKSILVDFDQFITLLNKWKANWSKIGSTFLYPKCCFFLCVYNSLKIHEGR